MLSDLSSNRDGGKRILSDVGGNTPAHGFGGQCERGRVPLFTKTAVTVAKLAEITGLSRSNNGPH